MEVCESPAIAKKEDHDCRLGKSKRCAYCEFGFKKFSDTLEHLLNNESEGIKQSIDLVKDYYEKSFAYLKGLNIN